MFSCSPSELISHLLQGLAFSGNSGVSLDELWSLCAQKLKTKEIDMFYKSVIWKWLFLNPRHKNALFIWKDNEIIRPEQELEEFLNNQINPHSLRVYPSSETQWTYLTGQEFSKKAMALLGEYPFQLLCEIAKRGPQGIFANDLSKATNQDPRSLTIRLKKLEDLKLIYKINMFNKAISQHTSLCIHTSFENKEIDFDALRFDDGLNHSRDANRLKDVIIHKLKSAPNGLRSMSDLQRELNLSGSTSLKKFFRRMIETLRLKGCVDKVMVRTTGSLDETSQIKVENIDDSNLETADDNDRPKERRLIYCIRYLKDLNGPEEGATSDSFSNVQNNESNNDDDEEQDILPKFNNVFHPTSQLFDQICKASSPPTSSELCKMITGSAEYRPFIRQLESITTFAKENNKVKPLQKIKQYPFDGISITRSFDSEGKFKFYRYEGERENVIDNFKTSESNNTLEKLNKKLFVSVGKHKDDSLLSNKRKTPETTGSITKRPKRETRTDTSMAVDDEDLLNLDSKTASPIPTPIPEKKRSIVERQAQLPLNFFGQTKTKPSGEQTRHVFASEKSFKRREELVSYLKENDGVIYTSIEILRELDKRLGLNTNTDMKTLIRDIAILVDSGVLEARDFKTIRTGQEINRKLLILQDPKFKPTDEKIKEVAALGEKAEAPKFSGAYQNSLNIIEADVKIYTAKPTKKPRLGSLNVSSKKATRNTKVRISTEHSDDGISSNLALSNKKGSEKAAPEEDPNKDPLSAFVSGRFKGKKREKKSKINGDAHPSTSRQRILELDTHYLTALFKLVVISRTFRKTIDFDRLAELFPGFNGKSLKQKWTSLRRKVGGQEVVLRSIEKFEAIVKKGIEEGLVKLSDMQEPIDYSFFLDLWDQLDSLKIADANHTLLYDLKANYNNYNVQVISEPVIPLCDLIENNSSRQKEIIASRYVFFESSSNNSLIDDITSDKEASAIKTCLRAICLTDKENFSASAVKNILLSFGDSKVHSVLTEMIREKEIDFFGEEQGDRSFLLTDKFDYSLAPKHKVSGLFSDASRLLSNLQFIQEGKRALIVSQGIHNGHMLSLLNAISNNEVDLLHIDKYYKLVGYESRLISKDKLDCDIVVKSTTSIVDNITKVKVPTGRAGSHVWIDLKGNIISDIWKRIISSVIWFILYRPGIQRFNIYHKFKAVMSIEDLDDVLKWLIQSKSVYNGKYDDYWVNDKWYTITG